MTYFGSYGTQGVGRALQNFRHRMSQAFNWSQPYQPSADMIDAENRRRWAQAVSQPAPERYANPQPTAAQRAAREAAEPPRVEAPPDDDYIKKRKTAPRIFDFFK